MADWFHQIEQGSLSTELLCLRLESRLHGSFAGQGFLTWNQDKGVEINALTNGGNTLRPSPLAIGSLIPPDYFWRLNATTRGGYDVAIDRLQFNCFETYSTHDTIVWSITQQHVLASVDFTKGPVSDQTDSVDFLLSNGKHLFWPQRHFPSNQNAFKVTTTLGEISAIEQPSGSVFVSVDSHSPQELTRVIDAVSFALCFWAGRILSVIAYEARSAESRFCRLNSAKSKATSSATPPFGHVPSLTLVEHQITLLQRAFDFFASDQRGVIGPLIHTRLSCPDAPFSVGVLILCSALERLAKEISISTGIGEEIPVTMQEQVAKCFRDSGLAEEMSGRFLAFVSKVNAPTAANAISDWCKIGFLGFNTEDKKAWKYRNESAHGNFALYGHTYDERSESVARRDRLANMFNKLVMHATGFEGLYFDYATQSERVFPPHAAAAS